jgi:hypothetical protein
MNSQTMNMHSIIYQNYMMRQEINNQNAVLMALIAQANSPYTPSQMPSLNNQQVFCFQNIPMGMNDNHTQTNCLNKSCQELSGAISVYSDDSIICDSDKTMISGGQNINQTNIVKSKPDIPNVNMAKPTPVKQPSVVHTKVPNPFTKGESSFKPVAPNGKLNKRVRKRNESFSTMADIDEVSLNDKKSKVPGLVFCIRRINRKTGKYTSLTKHRKTITKCEHVEAEYYAKGMCKKCYHNKGERTKFATKCEHLDKFHYAKGMCKACYLVKYHKKRSNKC